MNNVGESTCELTNRRWYDDRVFVPKMIHALENLPDSLRGFVLRTILMRIEKDGNADDLLKSVGSEKILGFYKSKKKTRSYDSCPLLHKTVNHIFLLPDDEQDKVAQECLKFTKAILEYISNCYKHQVEISGEDLRELSDKFVQLGVYFMQETLLEKHEAFEFSHDVIEDVVSDTGGMRVHGH